MNSVESHVSTMCAPLRDAGGQLHVPAGSEARIVSLVPSLTELLFDLGLGDRVVGRTGFCIHPREALRAVPKVGGTKDVKLDRIRELAPTHVVVNIDENRRETVDELARLVPHIIVTHPCAPRDNLDLYRLFGGIFGCEAQASRLQYELEVALAEAASARRALPVAGSVRLSGTRRSAHALRLIPTTGVISMSAPSRFGTFALACALAVPFALPAQAQGVATQCLVAGGWARLEGASPQLVDGTGLIPAMAQRAVVLLGEQHDDMDHHRWQLQTLAALHAQRPDMVIGFEMFPRRVQPVLDRWVAGELTEAEFLAQSEWGKVWSMPAELYLPLFHFARLNRIPMLALNVDAKLTRAIADQGWAGVPEAEREGVGQAAAALPAYEDFLFEIHGQHAAARGKPAAAAARSEAGFRNFVDSQLAWDRAMAEALLVGRQRHAGADGQLPLAVAIMGNGHVRFGHGVAHQLRALGEEGIGQLMPVGADTGCAELGAGLADAVFAVPVARMSAPPPPRLGVALEEHANGVRIAEITRGSLAERSGLKTDDIVTEAVNDTLKAIAASLLMERGQPAGTWLPLKVRRGDQALEVVVRFPPER